LPEQCCLGRLGVVLDGFEQALPLGGGRLGGQCLPVPLAFVVPLDAVAGDASCRVLPRLNRRHYAASHSCRAIIVTGKSSLLPVARRGPLSIASSVTMKTHSLQSRQTAL